MQNSLQIAHIEYSITTKSLDVFTIGCNGNCKGCCNPEIKDWNLSGLDVSKVISKLVELNSKYDDLIDKIIIVGGDPCDAYTYYSNDMEYLLTKIKSKIKKPIFLFTRHGIDEVPIGLQNLIDYVKTGEYIPEKTCENNIWYGMKLATSNQKIYKKENGKWKS